MGAREAAVGIVVLLALASGAYFFLGSADSSFSPSTQEFSLRIENKTLVSGATTLSVHEGDTVVIKVAGDEEEEFHLHGYDRSVDLVPGAEVTLTFVADSSGRFIFELEKSKTELGSVEVLP